MSSRLHSLASDPTDDAFIKLVSLIDDGREECNINAIDEKSGLRVIEVAAETGSIDTVTYLIENKKVNLDASQRSHNLLYYAAKNKDPGVMTFIAKYIEKFNDETTELHREIVIGAIDEASRRIAENPKKLFEKNIRDEDSLYWIALTKNRKLYNEIIVKNYIEDFADKNKKDDYYRQYINHVINIEAEVSLVEVNHAINCYDKINEKNNTDLISAKRLFVAKGNYYLGEEKKRSPFLGDRQENLSTIFDDTSNIDIAIKYYDFAIKILEQRLEKEPASKEQNDGNDNIHREIQFLSIFKAEVYNQFLKNVYKLAINSKDEKFLAEYTKSYFRFQKKIFTYYDRAISSLIDIQTKMNEDYFLLSSYYNELAMIDIESQQFATGERFLEYAGNYFAKIEDFKDPKDSKDPRAFKDFNIQLENLITQLQATRNELDNSNERVKIKQQELEKQDEKFKQPEHIEQDIQSEEDGDDEFISDKEDDPSFDIENQGQLYKQYQLEPKGSLKDSDGFFYAIADQLKIQGMRFKKLNASDSIAQAEVAEDLRGLTSLHIHDYYDVYHTFFLEEQKNDRFTILERLNAFVKILERPGTDVNHVAILALTRMLNINLVIFEQSVKSTYKRENAVGTLSIYKNSDGNYFALAPVNNDNTQLTPFDRIEIEIALDPTIVVDTLKFEPEVFLVSDKDSSKKRKWEKFSASDKNMITEGIKEFYTSLTDFGYFAHPNPKKKKIEIVVVENPSPQP